MSDNVSGLQRGIYAPVLKGGKRYSKTVRSGPSPFLAGGIAAAGRIFSGNILDATGLGGSASAAQVASSWLGAFQKAQRIT